MTIEYKEDEILEKEKNMSGKPLIGYINPYGQILDYSMLVGPYGHENWRNPATWVFTVFVSYIIKDFYVSELESWDWDGSKKIIIDNKYDGIDYVVKRGINCFYEFNDDSYEKFLQQLNDCLKNERESIKSSLSLGNSLIDQDEFDLLRYDLLKLFEKLYSKNDFFDSLGRYIYAERKETMVQKYKSLSKGDICFYNHMDYLMVQLMSYIKDICVQYLGYDSIERAWPLGDKNIVNNIFCASNGYTFSKDPRIIVTSERNVNERFYNWLLMDWTIQQVPKKIWDENNKKFVDENYVLDYVHNDKEKIFGKEIDSIRRLVPKNERYKYFR